MQAGRGRGPRARGRSRLARFGAPGAAALLLTAVVVLTGTGTGATLAVGALQFNGTSQYVRAGSVGSTTDALNTTTFTLETWFYRTGTGATTSTGTRGRHSRPADRQGAGAGRRIERRHELLPGHRRCRASRGRLRGGRGAAVAGPQPPRHGRRGGLEQRVAPRRRHLRRADVAALPRRHARPDADAHRAPLAAVGLDPADVARQRSDVDGRSGRLLPGPNRRGAHLERRPLGRADQPDDEPGAARRARAG